MIFYYHQNKLLKLMENIGIIQQNKKKKIKYKKTLLVQMNMI